MHSIWEREISQDRLGADSEDFEELTLRVPDTGFPWGAMSEKPCVFEMPIEALHEGVPAPVLGEVDAVS
jgi:hypothetical protein